MQALTELAAAQRRIGSRGVAGLRRRRLVMDVSTLCRWIGPTGGLLRVEHELAGFAQRELGRKVTFVFYDPSIHRYRTLAPAFRDDLLGISRGTLAPNAPLPDADRPSRITAMCTSTGEALIAFGAKPTSATWAGWLALRARQPVQRRIRTILDGPDQRPQIIDPSTALGPVYELEKADVLFVPASDWWCKDPEIIASLVTKSGAELVPLCHDLIPDSHPQYFYRNDVLIFRRYWASVFRLAATSLFDGSPIVDDAISFCAQRGFALRAPHVIPLGTHLDAPFVPKLPIHPALVPGRFALYVSTIEPRKGHALLLEAWRRLRALGIPQRENFRLVFVGRLGWMMEEFHPILQEAERDGSVIHLQGADDRMLANLYRGSAFTLYPSEYEGFGLPVIASFGHGKAVLASDCAPLRETSQGLASFVPTGDVAAWTRTLRDWIVSPTKAEQAAQRIRAEFIPRSWDDYSAEVLSVLDVAR